LPKEKNHSSGWLFIVLLIMLISCRSQPAIKDLIDRDTHSLQFSSSDTSLVSIFNWASETARGYVGDDNDPVGPWYEAALPGRKAFCIRDVSHQCIAAEILGQGKQNLNMFRKFVENISKEKDYCTYWEINRYNQPAPVDYASDQDFWYNLNANFDIIDACYKLYEWTGNMSYINDPVFDKFFQLSLNQYIERWQLQPDKIMQRPAFMNRRPSTIKYKNARGIPSYDESQDDLTVSSDLLGMIYNGFRTYSKILELRNQSIEGEKYAKKAELYKHLIDSLWWDAVSESYMGFYKSDKKFYPGAVSNSEFLLWYQVIENPERIKKSLMEISNSQVEVLSYLPMLFYMYGFHGEGYSYLGKLYTDKRRMYPEASAGAIEGIVRGMMGIKPSASLNQIMTCPRLTSDTKWVCIENLPVFSGLISLKHYSPGKTTFANKSGNAVTWRAVFPGTYNKISVDGRVTAALHFEDATGCKFSYTDITVNPESQVTAAIPSETNN